MNRQLVMTAASNYGPQQIAPFLHSLRRHYNGDVVIFTNTPELGLDEICAKYTAILNTEMPQKYGPVIDRFYSARAYLARNPHYNEIFFTDSRDVFFQASPFSMRNQHRLNFFLEPELIKNCAANMKWLGFVYSDEDSTRISHHCISCAGTTRGSAEGINEYLAALIGDFESLNPESGKNFWGWDQAIHNYLIYSHRFEDYTLSQSGEGLVQTLHHEKIFRFDRAGRLLNIDGEVCPVVHQFDRTFDTFKSAYRRSILGSSRSRSEAAE